MRAVATLVAVPTTMPVMAPTLEKATTRPEGWPEKSHLISTGGGRGCKSHNPRSTTAHRGIVYDRLPHLGALSVYPRVEKRKQHLLRDAPSGFASREMRASCNSDDKVSFCHAGGRVR